MHVGRQHSVTTLSTTACSLASAQDAGISDRIGAILGGVIVLGLVMIGFALPFV